MRWQMPLPSSAVQVMRSQGKTQTGTCFFFSTFSPTIKTFKLTITLYASTRQMYIRRHAWSERNSLTFAPRRENLKPSFFIAHWASCIDSHYERPYGKSISYSNFCPSNSSSAIIYNCFLIECFSTFGTLESCHDNNQKWINFQYYQVLGKTNTKLDFWDSRIPVLRFIPQILSE